MVTCMYTNGCNFTITIAFSVNSAAITDINFGISVGIDANALTRSQ